MNFLDVKTDYAFKKVFGSENSKEILISFLNAIIYDDSKNKIKDLTIVDPYNIPMIKGVKDTLVDVKAILDDDTKVIIEMQVLNHSGFEKRVLYNAAKNYSIQLDKSEAYHLLNPVIALYNPPNCQDNILKNLIPFNICYFTLHFQFVY